MDANLQQSAVQMLPANVLASLKQFKDHRDGITCLDCGYVGKMGVRDDGAQFGKSTLIAALFFFAGIGLGIGWIWSSALAGFFFVFALQRTAKPILQCPNCQKDTLG